MEVAYAAIEPPPAGATPPQEERAAASPPLPQRCDFPCGEKVAFGDRYLTAQLGTIVRINQRTATADTGNGHSWRVSFALLRHVLDI